MTPKTPLAQTASVLQVIQTLESDSAQLRANWCVPPEEGRFLHLMAVISGAQNVLEVGTSIGYSTLWFGLAVLETGGTVETIDASQDRLNQATAHFAEAGLTEERVITHQGQAVEILKRLETEGKQFDLMFIDARKEEYIQYLQSAQVLLKPNGLLIADNTESHKESMKDFLATIASSKHWESTNLATPNGILLARKRVAL